MNDTIVAAPIMLSVPLGDLKETDLMAALEAVMLHWELAGRSDLDETYPEMARAAAWLFAKYGRLLPPMQIGVPHAHD